MTPQRAAKLPLLGVSFILSLSLYLFVQIQDTKPDLGTSTIYVRLQARNVPPNLSAELPSQVGIIASGDPKDRERLEKDPEMVQAYIDFRGAKEGVNPVRVRLDKQNDLNLDLQPTGGLKSVILEQVRTITLPVMLQVTGQLVDDTLEYTTARVSPQSVSVTGANSALQGARAVATLDLSLVERGKTLETHVEIDNQNAPIESVRVEPQNVTIRPILVSKPEEKSVLLNVNFVGQAAQGFTYRSYRVIPDAIRVTGQSSDLAKITVADVTVDLTNLRETKTFDVKPTLPGGLRIVGNPTVQVQVVVDPVPPPLGPVPR